jgi:hypothetical protein
MPGDYASRPTASLLYSMNGTQTGTNNVVWRVSVIAITTGDAQDINTKAVADNIFTSSLTNNLAAGYLTMVNVPLINNDSLAADDYVRLQVERMATATSDTATSDAELVALKIKYSK